ncbi:MAG TPA: 50S ribosomal protein L25 [Candidatus Paceibacterota bacterium]|nr:50S ribosomal protein L25 [Candidatus Paceibacterota bacterium]
MELKVILRDTKKNPKHYLKEGYIPAVLYGKGIENIHVAVNQKEFADVLKEAGESTVIDLVIEGAKKKETHPVLIYEIQRHYLSHQPIHVDFYQIQKGQKIKTHIPVELVGEAPAIKNLGGVLVKNMDEIEVEALPQDLPHSFVVDISKLEAIDSKICIKDLNLPATIKVSASPETAIVSVIPPREEEVVAAAPTAEAISEVKIETEEKKAERKEEKAGEAQS